MTTQFPSWRRSFPAVLSALALLAGNLVQAATITSQTTGGNWSDPATWVGGVVPGPADVAIITASNAAPVICDVDTTCFRPGVNPGCQLNIADDVTLTATGTPIVNGSAIATAAQGTIVTGSGNSRLLLAGTANQFINGGGIYGNLEISNLVGLVRTPTTLGLPIAPGCTLTVDSGAFLQQGNAGQDVVGGGNFTLADGATLGILDPGGITADSSDTNGFISVSGGRTFSAAANYIYNGTAAQTTGTGLPAIINSLTISNSAGVTLTNGVTVSGTTTIRAGTLALGPAASLAAGSGISIAAGATFDVSGLGASATYNLGTTAILTASGTGTSNGLSAAAISGGAGGIVNLGSQPVILNYDGSHPALFISQGALSLNGNSFTVNTTNGSALAAGTYAVVQQAGGNIVGNGSFTVSGTAIGPGMIGSILVSGTNVNLVVAAPQLAVTAVNGGTNPVAGTPFDVVVQAQVAGGTPVNVVSDTVVTLSRASGTGALGGTLTGTILAGTNSVTISGVTYTKAESGVMLTATRTSGDTLTAGNSATFTVVAGAAANLTLTSGNNQSGLGLAAVTNPFAVTVTDANSNVVSGASVTFAIDTLPGSAIGLVLSLTNTTTDTNGQASSQLTLGNTLGIYTVTATSAGLAGSPVTFTATATGNLVITSVNGGTNPVAGVPFSVVVQAQGAGGTLVYMSTDSTVTLSRTTGTGILGGTLTGAILAGTSSVTFTNVTYTKAESGVVLTATRTGGNTLTAGNSAAFTVVAGAAANLTLTSGNNQSGIVGTALANPFVVTMTDAFGNLVSGVSVTFALAAVPAGATGQALSVTNATTAANGQASSTLTLGNAAGTYTATAASPSLAGSPVTFTAAATGKLAVTSVNGGTNPVAGTPFNVAVQLQGVGGTPINVASNTVVTLSRSVGTGTLGGILSGTILAGSNAVTISGVTYTKAESGVVLTATRTSGDSMVAGNSTAFTVVAGAAANLTLTSGNNQAGLKSTTLASSFVVTVTDAYGNAVSGTRVTFAITAVPAGATGQKLSVTNAITTTTGQASSILTLGNVVGFYYTVTATASGLNGSPVIFNATAKSGNYTPVASVTYEYQVCYKCHSAYSWKSATPPNGNSPNGSATSPVMTDVAQDFSPMNKSGHPVVTGLNNYTNSTTVSSRKGLTAAQMKAPWNVNVGTQTMMCSDCHDATTTNYVASAVQGPHGSANQFILRGPNGANWPAVTSFATSWCANCHVDTGISMDSHANHHSAGGCYRCHVVIPHGSKMSRLIADRDGSMPARYAYNNDKTTVYVTSFTKTSGSYGESTCRTSCGEHSSGSSTSMENW